MIMKGGLARSRAESAEFSRRRRDFLEGAEGHRGARRGIPEKEAATRLADARQNAFST